VIIKESIKEEKSLSQFYKIKKEGGNYVEVNQETSATPSLSKN
jgi:hypothetical protein